MRVAFVLLFGACTVGEAGPGSGGPTPDSSTPEGDAPIGGAATLQLEITSTTKGGQYAPRNVAAVWIENGGTFIKTIDRKAGQRKQHLVAWTTAAGAADADAVSGATRANHNTPLAITWDLKDRAGVVVPDGTYTIRMETAEDNSNQPTQNNQGTFTFVKGATAQTQTAQANGGFTNVSITFTPP